MRPLQSHCKLAEVEARLNKDSYLSRTILPGPSDAKMFLHLQSIKRYPDRQSYPNFYHWYVLMRQFSLCSIAKWLENGNATQDDTLVYYLTQKKPQEKVQPQNACFKKPLTTTQNSHQETHKLTKLEEHSNEIGHEIEYVMDVKIKEGIQRNMKEVMELFLDQELIQGREIQEFIYQRRVRIVAKMDPQKFQILKNKISGLEEVQTFESKKKDKRFKTFNSSSNSSGQV